jgi:hypothetical protein
MLSLTKALTSKSPVATAHSTRNTRYQLFIIPNVNFFLVIVSYSFLFHYFLGLLFLWGSLKMTCILSSCSHCPVSVVYFCFHLTSSTYLFAKLPSGRLSEQKKDISRREGKGRQKYRPTPRRKCMCEPKVSNVWIVLKHPGILLLQVSTEQMQLI